MTTVIDRRAAPIPDLERGETRLLDACATCPGHCCKNDLILIDRLHGDDPDLYETEPLTNPLNGLTILALRHKPNGDCIYLSEVGAVGRCSVYNHRPAICRAFDCGDAFAKLSRVDRRAMLKADIASRETFDQGRKVQAARAARKAEDARRGVSGTTLAAGRPEAAPGLSWRPRAGGFGKT